jgi:NhaB family Na+:H+ antiporter
MSTLAVNTPARRPVRNLVHAFARNFMGAAPNWYKQTILGFVVLNVVALAVAGPVVTAWLILGQFIFTLSMALKCYPLQPGGLIAIQAVVLGLVSPDQVYTEVETGLSVILLLVFMVAAVYFLKDFLYEALTRIMLTIRSRVGLAASMFISMAFLSAFLDALTILAILVTVCATTYEFYARSIPSHVTPADKDARLARFADFIRCLLMHAGLGAVIGGVTTLVGQPENVIVGAAVGWDFGTFFAQVDQMSLPAVAAGLVTCVVVEHFKLFGYGHRLPQDAYDVMARANQDWRASATPQYRATVLAQGAVCICLIVALAFHVAEVGLIGLAVIVFASTASGITDEHRIGRAFEAGLPFTALLVVFFVIVGMIHEQHLFEPIMAWVLGLQGKMQMLWLFITNGVLSAISDNVFVATVYIDQVKAAFEQGRIDQATLDAMAATIVMGTGIPAMATPNGHAALLFLLTSAISGMVRLSYLRMVWMGLPFMVVTTVVVAFLLPVPGP